jgi:hypothetical protein
LFGVGHILKAKHIDMMMAWGITEADVKVPEDSESIRRYNEAIQREEQALFPSFSAAILRIRWCVTSSAMWRRTRWNPE